MSSEHDHPGLTSHVAAIQRTTDAFSAQIMIPLDLTSHVAAIQLVAGAFSDDTTTKDLTSHAAARQIAAGAFFCWRNDHESDVNVTKANKHACCRLTWISRALRGGGSDSTILFIFLFIVLVFFLFLLIVIIWIIPVTSPLAPPSPPPTPQPRMHIQRHKA